MLDEARDVGIRHDTSCHELFAIDLARRRMLADHLVHDRLRRRGLVGLVVSKAPIADEIDHDVLVEAHAIAQRETRDEDHGLRIIGIDVEDRCFEHLRDVRAVHRRARIFRTRGREADLVVDHDVHRAAGVIRRRLRQLQRLHHDALPRERGIAVDQDRHHALALRVAATLLACADRTFDHRIDDFEMRRVERQRNMDVATRRAQVR